MVVVVVKVVQKKLEPGGGVKDVFSIDGGV